jgi:hypothetical protein
VFGIFPKAEKKITQNKFIFSTKTGMISKLVLKILKRNTPKYPYTIKESGVTAMKYVRIIKRIPSRKKILLKRVDLTTFAAVFFFISSNYIRKSVKAAYKARG